MDFASIATAEDLVLVSRFHIEPSLLQDARTSLQVPYCIANDQHILP